MRVKPVYFLLLAVLLASCGEYNKILKSTDKDVKYTYAKKYFEEGKYSRSITLLEELVPFFKGDSQRRGIVIFIGAKLLQFKRLSLCYRDVYNLLQHISQWRVC